LSHLLKRIKSGDSLTERLELAHSIFMLDAESTAEIIMWNDAEGVEKLMDECKHLIDQLSPAFRDWIADDLYTVEPWLREFEEGLEMFIVKCYQGDHDTTFVNGVRTLLHFGYLYLTR
jgi:hypothetical protein